MKSEIELLIELHELDIELEQALDYLQISTSNSEKIEEQIFVLQANNFTRQETPDYQDLQVKNQQLNTLKTKKNNLEIQVHKMSKDRDLITSLLSVNLVKLYERLKSHNRFALAEVEKNCCKGCCIKVRTSLIQEMYKKLVTCEHCGRILYIRALEHSL